MLLLDDRLPFPLKRCRVSLSVSVPRSFGTAHLIVSSRGPARHLAPHLATP
jgi:hypothetical protein